MRCHEGWAPASISAAVSEQTCLIAHGLYWKNLSVYRQFFPDEQILILFLDDFVLDPALELKRCFAHIGVDATVFGDACLRPRNSTSELRKDGLVASWLRQKPGFQRAKKLMPDWFVKTAKGLLTQQEKFTVEWDGAAKQQAVDSLKPDAEMLFEYCGKPSGFWNFAED